MANRQQNLSAVFRDAGLLREYVAANYGDVLTNGGTARSYSIGIRLCRRMARMTGIPMSEVVAAVRSDYESMDDDGGRLNG